MCHRISLPKILSLQYYKAYENEKGMNSIKTNLNTGVEGEMKFVKELL